MPQRPPKPCRKSGCRSITTEAHGYCIAHAALAQENVRQQRMAHDRRRGGSCARGYNAHWQRVRLLQLKNHPLCAICAHEARVVHHRDENPRNNCQSNLMSLCRECHERLHGRLRPRR
ncbi:HNH endonuclease [Nitratidesulfovibrio vulgaris DP4]|uniref:HNH endonuclease n=1 Tax=Nitratidesulfovibrio vulgaris (strain DP4) TaxID=391774 RepID=A0A0H3A789_NITV4|nr:HNH endonuclease [Nitratidesulfovibrio vulgaris DP4]